VLDVHIETGATRVFATAVDWPGWSRAGRDEEAAIASLLDHGVRYKTAVGKRIAVPRAPSGVRVVERARGDANTDFGVPAAGPAVDREPVDARELKRLVGILESCWSTFDAAAKAAKGKRLSTGPRGGGRTLAKIVEHQREAERAYLSKLGGRAPNRASAEELRAAFVDALDARHRGDLPDVGPRGGARWNVREAVRRSAWHALDHAWEIEDRTA
jgi:hypothetical protein